MTGRAIKAGRRSVEIPNPDKVLFPDDGVTKEALARYYRDVAKAMLPHVRGRPAHVHRYPDGLRGESWVQKAVPDYFPDWIETVTVRKRGGSVTQVVLNDAPTLVYLAGQATITPHIWLSRADRIDHPDLMVFDLDPSREDLPTLRDTVVDLRELLDQLGLPAYLKTSGSRGFHMAVPLDRSAPFDEVRELSRDISRELAERDPRKRTVEMRKEKRRGRLFVDWLRNAYAQTFAPPYAVRARPGAPVSVPIEWEELERVEPTTFGLADVPGRIEEVGDPWRGMRRRAHGVREARERLERLRATSDKERRAA